MTVLRFNPFWVVWFFFSWRFARRRGGQGTCLGPGAESSDSAKGRGDQDLERAGSDGSLAGPFLPVHREMPHWHLSLKFLESISGGSRRLSTGRGHPKPSWGLRLQGRSGCWGKSLSPSCCPSPPVGCPAKMPWEGARKGSEMVPGPQGTDGWHGGAVPCHRHYSRVALGRGRAVVHGIGGCLFLGTPMWASVEQARLAAQTQPEDVVRCLHRAVCRPSCWLSPILLPAGTATTSSPCPAGACCNPGALPPTPVLIL